LASPAESQSAFSHSTLGFETIHRGSPEWAVFAVVREQTTVFGFIAESGVG
jgi:hypothetical protein